MSFLFCVISVARIWGLLTLPLASDSIIPFNYLSYDVPLILLVFKFIFVYVHSYVISATCLIKSLLLI
jgi:hypothetical protein